MSFLLPRPSRSAAISVTGDDGLNDPVFEHGVSQTPPHRTEDADEQVFEAGFGLVP